MKRKMMRKASEEVQRKCQELHNSLNLLSKIVDDETIMANVMAAYMAESILSQDEPLNALTAFIGAIGNYIKELHADLSNDVDNNAEFDIH